MLAVVGCVSRSSQVLLIYSVYTYLHPSVSTSFMGTMNIDCSLTFFNDIMFKTAEDGGLNLRLSISFPASSSFCEIGGSESSASAV